MHSLTHVKLNFKKRAYLYIPKLTRTNVKTTVIFIYTMILLSPFQLLGVVVISKCILIAILFKLSFSTSEFLVWRSIKILCMEKWVSFPIVAAWLPISINNQKLKLTNKLIPRRYALLFCTGGVHAITLFLNPKY